MRWMTDPRPKLGDQRVITRFAWFPTNLGDGYTVWLEQFMILQIFKSTRIRTMMGRIVVDEWCDESTTVKPPQPFKGPSF